MKKQRLFYLDLIRAVALVCILVIHFNAAVTGYFTLPSKLFGSVLPFNIYLGDFGSSLFFMVSGAALQYTSPGQGREPLNLARFYQKRAKQFVKEYSPKSLRNREGFWYNRRKPPREAPSWKSTPKTPAAKQWLLT